MCTVTMHRKGFIVHAVSWSGSHSVERKRGFSTWRRSTEPAKAVIKSLDLDRGKRVFATV